MAMKRAILLAGVVAVTLGGLALDAQNPAADWPAVAGDVGAMKYSPADQITPANVSRLTQAWTYPAGGAAPIVINNVMYFAAGANVVALNAGNDVAEMLTLVDSYTQQGLHVTDLGVRIGMTRGQHQAFMRRLVLPTTVRPGQTVDAKLVVRVVRGEKKTLRFKLRIPRTLKPGLRTITLRGANPDGADDLFGELIITLGGDEEDGEPGGPRNLKALAHEMLKIQRYDGITLGKRSGPHVYRDDDLRIGGRAKADVIVRR